MGLYDRITCVRCFRLKSVDFGVINGEIGSICQRFRLAGGGFSYTHPPTHSNDDGLHGEINDLYNYSYLSI